MSTNEKNSRAYYLQRWGNAASIALLDPRCMIFTIPTCDGVIGYRIESNCAVVYGDPICHPSDLPELTQAFYNYCQNHVKNIVYALATQRFVNWALEKKHCSAAVHIGHEVILDPLIDLKAGKGHDASLLRNKYNQAVRKSIMVNEYRGDNPLLEQAMQNVAIQWLQSRKGPQIYLMQINIFADRTTMRWFYAQQDNHIIGILILNRIDAYQGWVINELMIMPEAPTFVSEVLILAALDILRQEGCNFFSVGTLPALGVDTVEGFGKLSTWLVKRGFKIAKKVFQLAERQRYWKKFQPRSEPTFLLFAKPRIGLSEIKGIMRAFNADIKSKKD